MHPDIDDSRFYNFLMYYNREAVFPRLDAILKRDSGSSRMRSMSDAVRGKEGPGVTRPLEMGRISEGRIGIRNW